MTPKKNRWVANRNQFPKLIYKIDFPKQALRRRDRLLLPLENSLKSQNGTLQLCKLYQHRTRKSWDAYPIHDRFASVYGGPTLIYPGSLWLLSGIIMPIIWDYYYIHYPGLLWLLSGIIMPIIWDYYYIHYPGLLWLLSGITMTIIWDYYDHYPGSLWLLSGIWWLYSGSLWSLSGIIMIIIRDHYDHYLE